MPRRRLACVSSGAIAAGQQEENLPGKPDIALPLIGRNAVLRGVVIFSSSGAADPTVTGAEACRADCRRG